MNEATKDLIYKYFNDKLSTRQIAERVGVSHETVRATLIKAGLFRVKTPPMVSQSFRIPYDIYTKIVADTTSDKDVSDVLREVLEAHYS